MAVAGAAPAAMAAPAPGGPCADFGDHVVATPPYDDSFYDCVPQYGVGKVSFAVENADGLPDDFDLSDASVTTYAPSAPGGAAYFGASTDTGFRTLSESSSTPTTSEYAGEMVFPISSVVPIDISDPSVVPADCAPGSESYDFAYRVSYTAATVTMTTTVGDVVYETAVTDAPVPLDLYLNATAGAFESGEPQCATNGAATLIAEDSGSGDFQVITSTNAQNLSPFPLSTLIFPGFAVPAPADLGDFDAAEVVPPVIEPAAPELAATGSEPAYGVIGLAGALLAAGAGATAWAARRRGAHAAR
jgi:hypothetical protein